MQRPVMLRRQPHRKLHRKNGILCIYPLMLCLHDNAEQCQDKEPLVTALIPHIGNPLLGQGVIASVVLQELSQHRLAVALQNAGSKHMLLGF